jgi:hypothetical protein
VVGLLYADNTVQSIRRQQTNITTNTNAILLPTNDTVDLGSVSVTDTSKPILFVKSVREKVDSLQQKRCTTSSRYPRAAVTRRAT